MRFASIKRDMHGRFMWVLSACTAFLTVACLTTDRIDFDVPENFPPAIASAPDAQFPLDEIGNINVNMPEPPDATEFPFEVIVRDVNTGDTLQYRLFRDDPELGEVEIPIATGEILPTGTFERGLSIFIPFLQLGIPGECHRFELLVTTAFANFVEPRRPQIEGDLAQATWWVNVTSSGMPTITMSCQ